MSAAAGSLAGTKAANIATNNYGGKCKTTSAIGSTAHNLITGCFLPIFCGSQSPPLDGFVCAPAGITQREGCNWSFVFLHLQPDVLANSVTNTFARIRNLNLGVRSLPDYHLNHPADRYRMFHAEHHK